MNPSAPFRFTLWDVGHGLAIWIKTPGAHNHWIDAGREGDFSPSWHVYSEYGERVLDYLIISHPDDDHINDPANLVTYLGKPRVLLRNKTLPDEEKFESGERDYQVTFEDLDTSYTRAIGKTEDPKDPAYNGGVTVKTGMLTWVEAEESSNNSSVVAFYEYAGFLFVMPGDIEESGWIKLWRKRGAVFQELIDRANTRILIAPHHGRESGYSPTMFSNVRPHLTLISDKKAKAETCAEFRTHPLGVEYEGETRRFFSTKTGGRMQFTIQASGACNLHIVDK